MGVLGLKMTLVIPIRMGFFLQLFVTQSSPAMPLQDLPLRIAFASWKSTPWLMMGDWSQRAVVSDVSTEGTCAPWTFHTIKQRMWITCQNMLSNWFGLVPWASWYFWYILTLHSTNQLQNVTKPNHKPPTNKTSFFHCSHQHHNRRPL